MAPASPQQQVWRLSLSLAAGCVALQTLLLLSGAGASWIVASDDPLDVVFSHERLNEYHLSLTESNWNWLNTHELLEEYAPGNVTFRVGEKVAPASARHGDAAGAAAAPELYEHVGIRYKGSKGSLEFCFTNATGNEGSNPWNKRLCKKLSIKISFDKYSDDGRFHDMKKIQLHGMMNDNSMMRECLAYGLYRRMGVHVPRCAHAKVFINGRYNGNEPQE